jgi:hypothetical protein
MTMFTEGSASFMMTLHDDGGTLNGGRDVSLPQDWTLRVTLINEAPSFSLAQPHVFSAEDAGVQVSMCQGLTSIPGV